MQGDARGCRGDAVGMQGDARVCRGVQGAKLLAAKTAAAKADYNRSRQIIAVHGRPWQTRLRAL